MFGKLDIGQVYFDVPKGASPPWLASWNPVSQGTTLYDGLSDEVAIGAMAHELCHALVHPVPEAEPVSLESEPYKREDRIAHLVGDRIGCRLGFPEYGEAAADLRYSNWVPASEMAVDEVVEADEIVAHIEMLIAEMSVWPVPVSGHICAKACSAPIHAELLVVDELEEAGALRWVSMLITDAGASLVSLEKADEQPTPAATVWILRYKRK